VVLSQPGAPKPERSVESGAKIRVENATKTFTDGAVVAFQNLSLAV